MLNTCTYPRAPNRAADSRDFIYTQVGPDGLVWQARGYATPSCTGVTPGPYLERISTGDSRYGLFRLLGGPGNAGLLLSLYAAGVHVQVGTPLIVPEGLRRNRPFLALADAARAAPRASSLGGWRDVTGRDLPAYRLAEACVRGAGEEELCRLFADHPVGRTLSFIRTADHASCARLLGVCVDPRWYVDPDKPDSPGKMQAFLGLRPNNFASFYGAGGRPDRGLSLAELTVTAWRGGFQEAGDTIRDDPRMFLWRVSSRKLRPWSQCLLASQIFTDYLRRTWLQAVTPGVELFVPGYFFRRPDEVAAFKDWMDGEEWKKTIMPAA